MSHVHYFILGTFVLTIFLGDMSTVSGQSNYKVMCHGEYCRIHNCCFKNTAKCLKYGSRPVRQNCCLNNRGRTASYIGSPLIDDGPKGNNCDYTLGCKQTPDQSSYDWPSVNVKCDDDASINCGGPQYRDPNNDRKCQGDYCFAKANYGPDCCFYKKEGCGYFEGDVDAGCFSGNCRFTGFCFKDDKTPVYRKVGINCGNLDNCKFATG